MVYHIYVEKKEQFAVEAKEMLGEIQNLLSINSITALRLIQKYDVEGITEELFKQCINTVFSEPQLDNTFHTMPETTGVVFATEYLPGQFDQRANSAAECIQLISQKDRPKVTHSKIIILEGKLTDSEVNAVKKYFINPVEAREASLEDKTSLDIPFNQPKKIERVDGFIDFTKAQLEKMMADFGLAMDLNDLTFCQTYFKEENRNPTITEIRMIDTYWSDHCRHTTFGTVLENIKVTDKTVLASYNRYLDLRKTVHGDKNKPICLMDMATIGAKYLKKQGVLKNLDESDEINACSVRIKVDNNGKDEDWLLLFKNETHNHPTEIEPFGGAATCIGGAIRDPLANRGYVYQAMRLTGAGNPLTPIDQTIAGKLPQHKIVRTAAHGYSSYGNQIGLATGMVDEWYHDGFVAKRMEIGAVIGAVPEENVRREQPADGDVVILIGGRTGRDGCGGATGSSKAHKVESLESCGAEVQKGNAPVERKLQRLFRTKEATLLIKRCNDFGAGGVSVAIGELADGLTINLDVVPKKYEGLDGTELAISESQERMAVVVEEKDAQDFIALANKENLEATIVATVTADPRLVMHWNGQTVCDIKRSFLNSNGAEKYNDVTVGDVSVTGNNWCDIDKKATLDDLMSDLNVCSKKGLSQLFDSTIGSNTVTMPFGGKTQLSPIQTMVAKIPMLSGETTTCSGMSWGYNPFISSKSPYHGAYYAVTESLTKLVASGFSLKDSYLTFQEYFERLGTDPVRWGKPFASLLGALDAQLDFGVGSIGGKDSMSGTFEDIDVPPTLVSFAVASGKTDNIITTEFKSAGNMVALLRPVIGENGLPTVDSLKSILATVENLIAEKKVVSSYAVGYGRLAEAICKMAMGNHIGVDFEKDFNQDSLQAFGYGSVVIEITDGGWSLNMPHTTIIGRTNNSYTLNFVDKSIDLVSVQESYEDKLEPVFPTKSKKQTSSLVEKIKYANKPSEQIFSLSSTKPKVIIPVFPGTNCEYDCARAMERAGAKAEIFVINNLTASSVAQSVTALKEKIAESQMVMLPGGFSGGDEPEGSAKFITAFFRNPYITEEINKLLKERDGLMLGICNGFQALIKLGLVPYGEIRETDENCPTLTFNTIGRHQSGLVQTRIASNKSPWLMHTNVDDIHTIAISHGEGRFVANGETIRNLIANGQIATQYVDLQGNPTMDIGFNPNDSILAIEGITSPDGRILGKMGHTERSGDHLYKNIAGDKFQKLFEGGVDYFS